MSFGFDPSKSMCEVCGKGHDHEDMVICDKCNGGFHTYCLRPPMAEVPEEEHWFCERCLPLVHEEVYLYGQWTSEGDQRHPRHPFSQVDELPAPRPSSEARGMSELVWDPTWDDGDPAAAHERTLRELLRGAPTRSSDDRDYYDRLFAAYRERLGGKCMFGEDDLWHFRARVRADDMRYDQIPLPPPGFVDHTRVAASTIHGWGCFAAREIPRNTLATWYDGKLLDWEAAKALKTPGHYIRSLCSMHSAIDGCRDPQKARGHGSFCNHSGRPNAEFWVRDNVVWIKTLRDVPEGAELTVNYGRGYVHS